MKDFQASDSGVGSHSPSPDLASDGEESPRNKRFELFKRCIKSQKSQKLRKSLMLCSEEECGGAHKITVYVKYTGEGSGSPLVEVTSCVFVLWMYLYFV